MRLDRCVKEMFLFLKLLSFNRLLKVALVLLQKCTLFLLPSPWKVISGSNRLPEGVVGRSKMSSLGSLREPHKSCHCRWCTHVGPLLHAQWHEPRKHVNRKPNPRESWGTSSFAWSPEMKQNSAVFWTQVSGGQHSCTPALFKHYVGEHSGSSSTQPGLNHYVSKPQKIMKTKSLLRKLDFKWLE